MSKQDQFRETIRRHAREALDAADVDFAGNPVDAIETVARRAADELGLELDHASFDAARATIKVRGRRVRDVRSGEWVSTANLALVVHDLLTDVRFGLGIQPGQELEERLKLWADFCDERGITLDGCISASPPREPPDLRHLGDA